MKKLLTLFVLGAFLLPCISLAATDVLAGGWLNASIEELIYARGQIDAQILALGSNLPDDTTTKTAGLSPTTTPRTITSSDVEVAIDTILNCRNDETDKAYSMIQEYYPYMTDEQKQKCLLSYGRWMCVEKAEEHIIDHLNDPYSYRRYGGNVDSRAALKDEEYRITVTLDYGAKNKFGGMVRQEKELYVYFKLDLENGNVIFTDAMMADVMERFVD